MLFFLFCTCNPSLCALFVLSEERGETWGAVDLPQDHTGKGASLRAPARKTGDEPGRGYSAGSAGPGSGPEDLSCFLQEPWRHLSGAGHWSLAGDLRPACPSVSETALSLRPNGQSLSYTYIARMQPPRQPCMLAMREGPPPFPLLFGIGGQGGIRTHETVSRPHAFQACAFSHSATCPSMRAGARILLLPPSGRGAFRHAATCPLDQPGQGPGKGSRI